MSEGQWKEKFKNACNPQKKSLPQLPVKKQAPKPHYVYVKFSRVKANFSLK